MLSRIEITVLREVGPLDADGADGGYCRSAVGASVQSWVIQFIRGRSSPVQVAAACHREQDRWRFKVNTLNQVFSSRRSLPHIAEARLEQDLPERGEAHFPDPRLIQAFPPQHRDVLAKRGFLVHGHYLRPVLRGAWPAERVRCQL